LNVSRASAAESETRSDIARPSRTAEAPRVRERDEIRVPCLTSPAVILLASFARAVRLIAAGNADDDNESRRGGRAVSSCNERFVRRFIQAEENSSLRSPRLLALSKYKRINRTNYSYSASRHSSLGIFPERGFSRDSPGNEI